MAYFQVQAVSFRECSFRGVVTPTCYFHHKRVFTGNSGSRQTPGAEDEKKDWFATSGLGVNLLPPQTKRPGWIRSTSHEKDPKTPQSLDLLKLTVLAGPFVGNPEFGGAHDLFSPKQYTPEV